jgi:hypothetical protein
MGTCAHCGGKIENKFLTDTCLPCIEKAMDALTPQDIATVMNDLARYGESITRTNADGKVERIDPDDFYLPAKAND